MRFHMLKTFHNVQNEIIKFIVIFTVDKDIRFTI